MATLGERVATLEAHDASARDRIDSLEDNYNGGGDVDYARSVRGRLHTLEATVAGFVLRRGFSAKRLSGFVQTVLVLAAVATAAAGWYAALAH